MGEQLIFYIEKNINLNVLDFLYNTLKLGDEKTFHNNENFYKRKFLIDKEILSVKQDNFDNLSENLNFEASGNFTLTYLSTCSTKELVKLKENNIEEYFNYIIID